MGHRFPTSRKIEAGERINRETERRRARDNPTGAFAPRAFWVSLRVTVRRTLKESSSPKKTNKWPCAPSTLHFRHYYAERRAQVGGVCAARPSRDGQQVRQRASHLRVSRACALSLSLVPSSLTQGRTASGRPFFAKNKNRKRKSTQPFQMCSRLSRRKSETDRISMNSLDPVLPFHAPSRS